MDTVSAGLVGTAITAMIAIVSWFKKQSDDREIMLHKERLELVNHQLAELYGPLLISCKAGRSAFEALLVKLNRRQGIFHGAPPSEVELKEWFHWMKHVFNPINERRESLILEHCHLIREAEVPQCFLDFSAHVAGYRAILAKWERGDFAEHYAIHEFPSSLDVYAASAFEQLKQEQAWLLGRLGPSRSRRDRGARLVRWFRPGARAGAGSPGAAGG